MARERKKSEFGKYLAQLIKDAGMTQCDFYSEAEIARPYFYDMLSGRTNPPPRETLERMLDVLEKRLPPNEKRRTEFINRVDEMIVFHALNKENIKDITKIMLKQFAKRVKNQMDMELCIADDVVDFISDKGFDKDYGARPIRRALQTELEDVLAEAVLMGDISIGDTVDISLSCEGTKKKIVVKKKTFADEKK